MFFFCFNILNFTNVIAINNQQLTSTYPLAQDNTIYTWGKGDKGLLGDPSSNHSKYEPYKMPLLGFVILIIVDGSGSGGDRVVW